MTRRKRAAPDEFQYRQATIRTMEVDNPLWSKEHDGAKGNPRKVMAAVNIRESAIGTMAARGLLNEPQIMAATQFRRLFEMAGGAGARAIDYAQEPVDGGGVRDPIPDRMIDAAQRLSHCEAILGKKAYKLMLRVVGEGCEIKDVAQTHRERTTAADYLKDGLEELAAHWRYSTKKRRGERS